MESGFTDHSHPVLSSNKLTPRESKLNNWPEQTSSHHRSAPNMWMDACGRLRGRLRRYKAQIQHLKEKNL